ncbi:MAG: hypothetical protein HY851_09115 [candidate division Zixibacteria bacterium]|nr:hypothetical protein [candidate division Zixibacteria bacterium]
MKTKLLAFALLSVFAAPCSMAGELNSTSDLSVDPARVVYVLFNDHIEGESGSTPGSSTCLTDTIYQTLPPPPIGTPNLHSSFAVDLLGIRLLNDRTSQLTDSYGGKPRWYQCPVGEFWQTEGDPDYGGKLFSMLDFFQAGHEFGVQGHAIYYSGQNFCWYQSPHTETGILWKFRDMDHFADLVYHDGRKVNEGKTYTGGHKIESPALGDTLAERIIDSAAYALGYRIAYEDYDGHIEDEPAGVNNARACYYLYEAQYSNGVKILKIDMNGSINDGCQGNTPRCETPDEAIRRFDSIVAARLADPDTNRLYYFAGVVHAGSYFSGRHKELSGLPPSPGEYRGFNRFLDSLQARIRAGVTVKFATPVELWRLFNPAGACCAGVTGNVDCDPNDGADISDLSALIDHLFIAFTPLCCEAEANIDGIAGVDISDLSALIDHLFINQTLPAGCP